MSKIVAAAIESSAAMTLRTNSTDRVTVTSAGLVGVGTTTPLAPLHVVSDLNAEVRITASTITGADFSILPQTNNTTPVFRIYDRANSVDRLTISSAGLVTIPGTLTVSGAATLSSTLTVGTATMAVPSGTAPLFGARAYGYIPQSQASGTKPTYSGNVASITRINAYQTKVTFITPMPHANYTVVGMGKYISDLGHSPQIFITPAYNGTTDLVNTANEFYYTIWDNSTDGVSYNDTSHVHFVVYC